MSLITNSTLVMPFLQTGGVIPWEEFNLSTRHVLNLEEYCAYNRPVEIILKPENLDMASVRCYSFNDFFDLHRLTRHFPNLKIISTLEFFNILSLKEYAETNLFSIVWFHKILNNYKVINIKDENGIFDYRIQDSSFHLNEKLKYNTVINMENLFNASNFEESNEIQSNFQKIKNLNYIHSNKIIYKFGSLFGSNRLSLNEENSRIKNSVSRNLVFYDKNLLKISDFIVQKLGGKGTFVGIHYRTNHRIFESQPFLSKIHNIIDCSQFNPVCPYHRKGKLRKIQHLNSVEKKVLSCLSKTNYFYSLNETTSKFNIIKPFVVYIATNSKASDTNDNAFHLLLKNFPGCVFTLNDFIKYFETKFNQNNFFNFNETSRLIKDNQHFSSIKEDLYPFIDQLVVSQGDYFIPTLKSTYSSYAGFLHDIL
ncbi:hypothetical protein HK099_003338 [Clydaea vesicula]|uniref:Uncharacterized protein n=1 Tax=Clydaea vesicula TaxID=447962 RepID=A0AAD5U772_9FUNG|nr:hypothetical protein HK099_003338 [Clydaea vesicula]